QFEKFAMYCESKLAYIPLTFMLGFFVTIVVDRWRSIFQNMGWIENLALTVSALLRGDSKEAVLYRRSIIRYTVLCQEVKLFRTSLAQLCQFDWVPIPIAYPQVDLFVPFMTILQFIFFVGWMKVAEALLNPLGEDDDDFECNFLIDKNIATGLSIVDNTHDTCPNLLPDRLSDPNYHPVYSEESHRWGGDNTLIGSAEGIEVAKPEDHVRMVSVDVVKHDEGVQNYKSSNANNQNQKTTNAGLDKIDEKSGSRQSSMENEYMYRIYGQMFEDTLYDHTGVICAQRSRQLTDCIGTIRKEKIHHTPD
ncbi:Bestrophin, partial [Teladorsagia circumcincta]